MALNDETRTTVIGLSVAMLGQAPGTAQLEEWADALAGGMSLGDLAESIADSRAFRGEYPSFDSNENFAKAFIGSVMDGNVSATVEALAVDYAIAQLNDEGMSRGGLALLLVQALHAIALDEDHDLRAEFGGAAVAFHNKVEVAAYHTYDKRIAEPSSSVLEGVTDDPATVEAAKRDIDSPPADAVFGEPGAFAVDENASGAETPLAVGRVEATDANGDEVTYRLVDAPDGFAIDAATGAVTYTGEGLDHEAAATVELTVHASSTGANGQPTEVPLKVTVNVKDVQESDAVFADAMLSIDENEAEGMVGKVEATDAEGDAVAYSLAEGSPAGFSIDAESGAVSYKGDGLDHEEAATVDLTVIATSIGASNMATDVSRTFTVKVGDVTESDAVFKDAMLSIDENEAEGMVGKVSATDAEGDDVTYRLAEDSPAGFSIDAESGAVSYKGDGLDHEEAATVDLTVIATSIGASNMETDVSQTFTVNVGDVDDLPDEPMRFVLTARSDPLMGGDADDTFIAVPERTNTGAYIPVLNPKGIDSLDGGAGMDTLTVSWAGLGGDLTLGVEDVKNIEKVVLSAFLQGVNANLTGYEGLDMVELATFGAGSDIRVTVKGASVSVKEGLTIGGDATIVGADGAVDINAGEESVVHVGSGDHTETVMVKGGASVNVDSGATGDKQQSKTITKVVVDGVERGDETGGSDAENPVPNTDNVRTATIPANNQSNSPSATAVQYLREATKEEIDSSSPRIISSDGAVNVVVINASEAALNTYYIADLDKKSEGVELGTTVGRILVTTDQKKAAGYTETPAVAAVDGTTAATVTVNSDAIETIQLHNTNAVAVVTDNSQKKDDDDKDVPVRAPLAVAVEDFDGVLRLEGDAVSDDITFTVVKASDFDLVASTKMVTIEGDAKLTLDIDGSAETIKVSGEGGVTMAGLSGMDKLKMIDASGSSGANHFRSQADKDGPTDKDQLKALTMVKGGTGKDTVTLRTSTTGKLEHVDTGDGGDMVTITGAHRTKGLEVDLGEGGDTFVGNSGGNKNSRIDGGEGTDTLKLSATPATYKDGDDTKSIFSNFEVLDVGGGVAGSTFDVELLGIDTGNVLATGGTAGAVTLKNMAKGMGITVQGKKGMATTANITHEFLDGVKSRQDLNVNLRAIGDDEDKKSAAPIDGVTLTLDVDSKIVELVVDSSATIGGSKTEAPDMAPEAPDYRNTLTLDGDVRDIIVTGDASLTINGGGLGDIESVDASASGGVTFVATGTGRIELIGGDGDDTLSAETSATADGYEIDGGAGDDTLTAGTAGGEMTGGAGADMLFGNDSGVDMFIIEDASDSQLSFDKDDTPIGMDTITNFAEGGTDKIVLPESLYESLLGGTFLGATSGTVNVNTGTTGANPTTLKAYLEASDTKDGFFETDNRVAGTAGTLIEHPVTVIGEDTNGDGSVNNTWIFIDIDGDGDLNLAMDLAIKLVGDLSIATGATGSFMEAS